MASAPEHTPPTVHHLSRCTVRLSEPRPRSRIDLTAWDLFLLPEEYMQLGFLYSKPTEPLNLVIERLKTSLSRCLVHFYPLSGRLATDDKPSVYIDCNDAGVEFIVAECKEAKISDMLTEGDVPEFLRSFFPMTEAINYDGHSSPLLVVQVTELKDGFFIARSVNHTICDGQAASHFTSSWFELCRGDQTISRLPKFDRPTLHHPILFNPSDEALTRRRWAGGPLSVRKISFTRKAMAALKEKANTKSSELKMKIEISSFQALYALIWRAATRAKKATGSQPTAYLIAMDNRHRLHPPLPREYFGNCVTVARTQAPTNEVLGQDLGSVAHTLHKLVTSHTRLEANLFAEAWVRKPFALSKELQWSPWSIIIAGSARYGEVSMEDFGLGKCLGTFTGSTGKADGRMTALQGVEGPGSVDMTVWLNPVAMNKFAKDEELLDALSPGSADKDHVCLVSKY